MKKAKTTKKTTNKKQQKKKIIVTTLAVGATGILGYFGWQYFKKKKGAKKEDMSSLINKINEPIITEPILTTKPRIATKKIAYSPPVIERKSDFPLGKGSKGELVKKLQEALITK